MALQALGPTFVKIGQFLSTRADLLPADYIAALARLQDHVEPFPFADVERIVQEELGVRLSNRDTRFTRFRWTAEPSFRVAATPIRDTVVPFATTNTVMNRPWTLAPVL